MVTKRLASDIPVGAFRLLYQWPLVFDPGAGGQAATDTFETEVARLTADTNWRPIPKPIEFPPKEGMRDGGGYGEFVYFHDFAQKFLYPSEGGAFSLLERRDIASLKAGFYKDTEHEFSVERLTLHMFRLGIAVMTLELKWQCQSTGAPLMLAQAQRIIDHLRRSYTPFWDKNDVPGRVPLQVTLIKRNGVCTPYEPLPREAAEASVLGNANPDAKIFRHWAEMILPLKLLAEGGHWRDPSDERIPLNSFIALDPLKQGENGDWKADIRAALLEIRDGDWHRIMDADEPDDDPYAYNPEFARQVEKAAYYDRFFPDPDSGSIATRHLFGGIHYAAVVAGDFAKTLLPHWRRHYAQLSLIARLENATLLAVSSRISVADADLNRSKDHAAFDKQILEIQEYFLLFVHQFRFTGVTSQLQGAEMYQMWRKTLHLDALFADVRAELEVATAAVIARQQITEARATTRLTKVATLGVIGGLIVGAGGMNVLVGDEHLMDLAGWSEWRQFLVVTGGVLLVSALALRFILPGSERGSSRERFNDNAPLVLVVLGVISLLAAVLV